MGGFSRRRSSGLAGFEMIRAFRLLAYLAIGLLLGGSASYSFAGYAQLKPPANLGGSVGSRVTAGTIAANAGQFSAGFTTQIAGKTVTMPATMRFASNAAQVAIGAIRLSPTALVGSAVAAWLLPYGIEYINGQFMVQSQPVGNVITAQQIATCAASTGNIYTGTKGVGCQINEAVCADGIMWGNITSTTVDCKNGAGNLYTEPFQHWQTSAAQPTPLPAKVPAVEEDFAEPAAEPLPDQVAEELAPKAVPIPLEEPAFNPEPVTVPLSNPYPKPNGQPGETVKDVVKVTPAPGEKVKIETEVQPVTGPNGVPIPTTNPDGSSNPDAAPEDKPDFCIQNPDALACWKEGEPENAELEKVTVGTSITPVNIGGGASCPASKTVNYMGANLVISFTPICTAAGWIHPIVIALAWLSAGFILIGAFKQG